MIASVDDIELGLLMQGIEARYGHDLRDWDRERVRARAAALLVEGGFSSLSALQEQLLRDETWLEKLLVGLWSRPNRPMFAEPAFWRAVRWKIAPVLRTWPTVRAWVAGCATGEDAWSLALLFDEEGLGTRATLHATDIEESSLRRGRAGRATAEQIALWEGNYRLSGGLKSVGAAFADDPAGGLRTALADRITWSRHVPGVEPSFNEFHLILFRSPFVWTAHRARTAVGTLLRDSLANFGFLCLDAPETLECLPPGGCGLVDPELAIARRVV